MNRKMYQMMMSFAMMGMMFDYLPMDHKFDLTEEDLKYLNEAAQQKRKERLLQRGAKEWNIDGIIVIARNLKNAKRKVNNFLQKLAAETL